MSPCPVGPRRRTYGKAWKEVLEAAAKVDATQLAERSQAIQKNSITKLMARLVHLRLGVDPRHADQRAAMWCIATWIG
jgi:hypothetical protein